MLKLKKSTNDFVGIDIDLTSIKIVRVSLDNQVLKLEDLLVIPIPFQPKSSKNNDAAFKTSELLASIQSISNKNASLSIPFSACTESRIDINQDLTNQQIDDLVRSKINSISPYSVNDTRYDYFVSQKNDTRTVNICAIKKDVLENHLNLINGSGAKPVAATGGSFAFEKAIPVLLTQEQLSQNIAIFDIGFEETTVYLLKEGQLIYSRETHFGMSETIQSMVSFYNSSYDEAISKLISNKADDVILQDNFISDLFSDLHQMLVREIKVFMMNSPEYSVDKLYLAGDFSTIPNLIEYINQQNRFVADLFNPFSNMPISTHISPEQVKKDAPKMINALIAATSIKQGGLNLMPWRELMVIDKKKQFMTGLIASVISGVMLIGLVWIYQKNELRNQQSATNVIKVAINDDKDKIAKLGDIEAKKKLVQDRLLVISELQDKRFELVKALNYMVMNFPEQAYLLEMTKDGDNFILKGRAKNTDAIVQLIRSLRFYPYFYDVTVSQWIADSANPDGTLAPTEVKSDGWGSFTVNFTVSGIAHEAVTNTEVYFPTQQTITNPTVNGSTQASTQVPNTTSANPLDNLTPNQATIANAAGTATNVLLKNEPLKPVTSTTTKTQVTKTETTTH